MRTKSDFNWWLMTSHIDISAGEWQLMTSQLFSFLGYFDFLLNLHHSGFIHRRKSVILLNFSPSVSIFQYQAISQSKWRTCEYDTIISQSKLEFHKSIEIKFNWLESGQCWRPLTQWSKFESLAFLARKVKQNWFKDSLSKKTWMKSDIKCSKPVMEDYSN